MRPPQRRRLRNPPYRLPHRRPDHHTGPIAVTPVPTAGGARPPRSPGTEFFQNLGEALAAFNDAGETLPAGTSTHNPLLTEIRRPKGMANPIATERKHRNRRPPKRRGDHSHYRSPMPEVVVTATEAFLNYFHDATFTVTTSAGNRFYLHARCRTTDEAVFVEAGSKLTPSPVRPSSRARPARPSTATTPSPSRRSEQAVARTRHTFLFDAQNSGSASVTINLYDEYLDERTFDIERERQRRRGNQRIKTTRDMKTFTGLFTTLSLGSPPADGLRKREPPPQKRGKRNDRSPQRQAS